MSESKYNLGDVSRGNTKNHIRNMFSPAEDVTLIHLVKTHGENWFLISSLMPNRNVRQCRERWNNYLKPSVNRNPFTEDEDKLLLEKVKELGGQWKKIVPFFINRTVIQVKNRYSCLLRKAKKENLSKIYAGKQLKSTNKSKYALPTISPTTNENIPPLDFDSLPYPEESIYEYDF